MIGDEKFAVATAGLCYLRPMRCNQFMEFAYKTQDTNVILPTEWRPTHATYVLCQCAKKSQQMHTCILTACKLLLFIISVHSAGVHNYLNSVEKITLLSTV